MDKCKGLSGLLLGRRFVLLIAISFLAFGCARREELSNGKELRCINGVLHRWNAPLNMWLGESKITCHVGDAP